MRAKNVTAGNRKNARSPRTFCDMINCVSLEGLKMVVVVVTKKKAKNRRSGSGLHGNENVVVFLSHLENDTFPNANMATGQMHSVANRRRVKQ